MGTSTEKSLRIGEWCVDPTRGEIVRAGQATRLEARTMRLLLCLAERRGEVVSIDFLLDQVWTGVTVAPDSVYQAVASLRRMLGDDPKQPAYIATVPRLGYRMVAIVEPWNNGVVGSESGAIDPPHPPPSISVPEPAHAKSPVVIRGALAVIVLVLAVAALVFLAHDRFSRDGQPRTAATTTPPNAVAVLPFLDLTEGMKNEEFADGVTEELIDKLSHVSGLQVASATASFYFKGKQIPLAQMAQTLGAASIVDGSVRKSQGWIRVDVRLVRAASGYVLWSQTYDQPEGNIFAIQDDIATAVTKSLRTALSGDPHPNAPTNKPQHAGTSGPQVQLASGALRGETSGTINVFKGIPYAQPPVGPLRWREPQSVAAWPGLRDATKPSHPCMQSLQGTDNFIQPLAATYGITYPLQKLDPSEDCLYLNIWTPQLGSGAHLPVMVWLHGGSNRVGSGAEPGYDGALLALNGVVVVTINYRLGIMGFFAHPELTAESPHHTSGNYGLLDQIAALGWVRQNIAQFGGDPKNVTLFGESAGSVDATVLMTSPLSTNLFGHVIAESGPAFGLGVARTVSQMEPLGMAVGKEAGAKPGSQLAVLRKLSEPTLAEIENRLISSTFKGYDANSSIVDGWVLPQSPARAFALGRIQPVDLLVGLNAREFSAFRVVAAASASKSPQSAAKPGISDQLKQFADTARPLYGHWTDLAVTTYFTKILVHGAPAADQATNDIGGSCPVGAEAALTTSAGHRAFVYLFNRSIPGKGESELGSFHSLELPYVFGTFQARTFSWLPFDATDFKLSKMIQAYWTNFAKYGDPNDPSLPHWIAWNADKEPYMTFSSKGDSVPLEHFSPIYCHLSPSRLKDQLANY